MAGYGYKPRSWGARPAAPRPRSIGTQGGSSQVTPLGISTRTASKPAFSQDQVNQSLAANPQSSMAGGQTWGGQVPQVAPKPAPQAPQAPGLSYDYSVDPILNQITALSSQQRSDAQANALKLKKQLAIDYGDEALGTSLGDENTAKAAAGNPFGVRQQLKKNYETGLGGLEEDLNQQNLFYGGHRAKELGEFANDYQGQLVGAAGQQQGLLGQIDDNLLQALLAADDAEIGGQGDAADRALQMALSAGIDPGAGAGQPPVEDPEEVLKRLIRGIGGRNAQAL